jgi:hypothetical protein
MPSTITIDGPVVPVNADNEVLRDAFLHSPGARVVSSSSYHLIEVGIREGAFTSWIGSWNQSRQKIDAATPTSILDVGRKGMRLKAAQTLVVRVTASGAPLSLRGTGVTFRFALVGGRDGPARALVTSGAIMSDLDSRAAIASLERQINTGGLAQWDETVALLDPACVAGPVLRLPFITPTQLTASVNDYAPTSFASAAVMRLSSDASRDITGIAGGSEGREVVLFNVGSQNVVLKNASGSSAAANQFSIGADFTLTASASCVIWYDAVTFTWRLY